MTDPAKEVFEYQDEAGKARFADPFATVEALYFHCASIGRDYEEMLRGSVAKKQVVHEDGTPAADEEGKPVYEPDILASYEPRTALRPVICEVFKLNAFDAGTGRGMTADKVDAVLDSFLEFCDSKKKQAA